MDRAGELFGYSAAALPLVSIGVPVRNGGSQFREALEQLVNQTYSNIEIIISSNASTDETDAICAETCARDSRIHFFRQNECLSAIENFRFVADRANGRYFIWAAHDDRRSLNYVERLLEVMLRNPDAAIAFGEVAKFSNPSTWAESIVMKYDFAATPSENFYLAILRQSFKREGYLHIYGMILRKYLQEYPWYDIEGGPDEPLLFYLSRRGGFIRATGCRFYCYKPVSPKSTEQRAQVYSLSSARRGLAIRRSLVCAKAGCCAERRRGNTCSVAIGFGLFYVLRLRKSILRAVSLVKRRLWHWSH